MRAEFYRADAPTQAVGWATWAGTGVDVESKDDEAASAIRRVFRSLPVAVDDPALRSAGTAGPVVLQPGSLRWFTAAARARSEVEGLGVRFVSGETGSIGWDPAGAYRTFQAVVERDAAVPR